MSHSFLPKRKSGLENGFPDPPTISVWDERPRNHLEVLGKAIDVASTGHRIHSIPDPWARVILFDRALYNSGHLLHKAIQGEWRGLLAILGLRERRNFAGLSARDVMLDAVHAAPGSFSLVVAQLRPSTD
ncbi:MAG TPA: hypothetical protein VFF39_07960, partial [Verrucomicrobiae bacterium]|nr:hypothetical protein [Verrucomicrobiae bacterium]